MTTTYPGTIDVFTNPAGTNTLDSPDHALQHTNNNGAIVAIENTLGTTAGTSVLKTFATGDFAARVNNETLGTPSITGGTISTAVINTPTIRNWDGWTDANETWTFASATTITVPTDATTKYKKGDRIKLTQGATVKYFYIVAVSSTVLTITGGTSYTFTNSAVSSNYYSHEISPIGFPDAFTFAPVLIARGTAFSMGNAVVYGRFSLKGVICTYTYLIGMGSTTTYGTNQIDVSLPISAANNSDTNYRWFGASHYYDSSATTDYEGGSRIIGNLDAANTFYHFYNNTTVTSAVPFTWAVSDEFGGSITYEIL